MPMVTITGPEFDISLGLLVKIRRLSRSALVSSSSAPYSMKGRRPALERGKVVEVQVIDVDLETLRGERQHERNADMSGAADNGQVRCLRVYRASWIRRDRRRSRLFTIG